MKTAVIAGTLVDTRMGTELLEGHGLKAEGYPAGRTPTEQSLFQIGPAEVVKITFVLLLAKQIEWLREEKEDLKSFGSALFVAAHTLGLCGLYFVVSHDMGNGLVFVFIFLCMAFVAGFALRWFLLLFAGTGGFVAAVLLLDLVPENMEYMRLKPGKGEGEE